VSARGSTAGRAAWAALILTLVAGIAWGAHQPHAWDVDNIAPGSVLRAIAARFGPGWYSSYGPLPYLITAVATVPALALFAVTGELGTPARDYPWGFAHPDASVLALIVMARLVTVSLALATAWVLARDHREAGGRHGWLVPLLLTGSPVFAYYARTSNVDMHYVAWLALAFALAGGRAPSVRRFAAAAACAVAALCSKEQSAPFAAVAFAWPLLRSWRGTKGAARARAVTGVVLAGVAVYVAAYALPFNLEGWRAHHHFVFHVAKYERTFPLTVEGLIALGGRFAALLPVGLGWPVLAGVAAAIGLRVPLRGLGPIAIGAALYVAGFLGPVGYIYPRFMLPLLLLGVPVAARGLERLLSRAGARGGPALIGAVLALLALTGGPNLTRVQLTDSRIAAGRWLESRVPPGALVEIAGNPRFQARPPRDARVLLATPDSLRASPRGPRGDIVLLSAQDAEFFERDAVVRRVWLDSLAITHDGPVTFRPSLPVGNVGDLFVSPVVRVWVRRGLPPRRAP
jgi:hypothetical protein